MRKWRLSVLKCERKSDGSLWTPAGDIPYPLNGWNFARLEKTIIGWFLHMDDRWVFTDPALFEIKK